MIRFLILFLLFISSAQASEPVRICDGSGTIGAPAYIAQEKGFFKQNGLDVSLQILTSGKLCQDAVLSGSADFAGSSDSAFIFQAFADSPLRIIAFQQKNPETTLVARRDVGINKPEDLKGKIVAYMPGTAAHFFLIAFLEKFHLKKEDLQLVSLQPPAMQPALEGKKIDAMIMWQPWAQYAVRSLGANAYVFSDQNIYHWNTVVSTLDTTIQKNPDTARKILKSLIMAQVFMKTHSDESIQMVATRMGYDADWLKKNWPALTDDIQINSTQLDQMKHYGELLIQNHPDFKDRAAPDFTKFIDPSILKSIDPNRVKGL